MDDDTFRAPGSPYEHEEVVAIAAIPTGLVVDWMEYRCPSSTLWLPEPLFDELAGATSLGQLDKYAQSRLDPQACARLEPELVRLLERPIAEAPREATLRVLARVREVIGSTDLELLVEGP